MSFIVIIIAYLLGSIPFGLLIGKIKGIDLRKFGSGNIGATNAYRILGFKWGLLVAVLDILKGIIAVQIAQSLLPAQTSGSFIIHILAGLAAIAGHNWSIFLGFNGGRGVATAVGVLLKLEPLVILILLFVWLGIIFITRYVSLASITSALLVPFLMFFLGSPGVYIIFGVLTAVFVIYRHRPNIARLLAGNENRITWNPGGKIGGKKK